MKKKLYIRPAADALAIETSNLFTDFVISGGVDGPAGTNKKEPATFADEESMFDTEEENASNFWDYR